MSRRFLILSFAGGLSWAAGSATGQVLPISPQPGSLTGQPSAQEQEPGGRGQARERGQQPQALPTTNRVPFGAPAQSPDEFSSIWSIPSPPEWTGFPAFPSRLQGYGSYPLPFDPDSPSAGMVPPLPAADPEPSGWPAWVRLRARKPLPYAVNVGLLIAQHGRVWWRDTPDEPFVPSLSYDAFATLPVGGAAELRSNGSFEVLFHQSTRLEAKGTTALRVLGLDEQTVSLALDQVSFLRLRAMGRTQRLRLPDGSRLEMAPSTSLGEGVSALSALFGGAALPISTRPAFVEIRRVDEPSYYGGRATITNYGGAAITWKHALGTIQIGPGQRALMFLTAPTTPTDAGLVSGDARVQRSGAQATCRAVTDTEVRWSGARIRVPAGASVRLRSFAGEIRLGGQDG